MKRPFAILARLKRPLDFNAIDGEPVDLVCLLLLPAAHESGSLTALARIARRLCDPAVHRALRRAPNRAVPYNVMQGAEVA